MKPPTKYMVLDCETTGLPTQKRRGMPNDFSVQKDFLQQSVHITEIGAAVFSEGELPPEATMSATCKLPDGVFISPESTLLNGIDAAECNGPSSVDAGQALIELVNMINDHEITTIVTQNGYLFDIPLLASWNSCFRIPTNWPQEVTIIDTQLIWTSYITNNPKGQHEDLGHFYGRMQQYTQNIQSSMTFLVKHFAQQQHYRQAHRALLDVYDTNAVFQHLTEPYIWDEVFNR